MHRTTLAIDLAKSVFEVAVSHNPGTVARRRRLSRSQLARFMEQEAPSTVLMEACGSAHHWGRRFERIGHRVLLLPPHDVATYRKGQKTDHRCQGAPRSSPQRGDSPRSHQEDLETGGLPDRQVRHAADAVSLCCGQFPPVAREIFESAKTA